MMIVEGRIPATSPARVIQEIDAKLEVLAGGDGGANGSDAKRLREERRRWVLERERNCAAWLEHHRRLYRVHLWLNGEHFKTLRKLEREV